MFKKIIIMEYSYGYFDGALLKSREKKRANAIEKREREGGEGGRRETETERAGEREERERERVCVCVRERAVRACVRACVCPFKISGKT